MTRYICVHCAQGGASGSGHDDLRREPAAYNCHGCGRKHAMYPVPVVEAVNAQHARMGKLLRDIILASGVELPGDISDELKPGPDLIALGEDVVERLADLQNVDKLNAHLATTNDGLTEQLITHADPSEVERLRAENDQLRQGFYQQVTDPDLKEIADFVSDDGLPKKCLFFVPDAHRLANTCLHMVREVQASRGATQRADAAEQMLRELLDCPWVVEPATIPKAGIEAAPQQVVGTMHVALVRLRKARALLSASAEPAKPVYPPLETWPAWANWCGLDSSGYWVFYEREPVTSDYGRTPSGGSWGKPVAGEPQPYWASMIYQRPDKGGDGEVQS